MEEAPEPGEQPASQLETGAAKVPEPGEQLASQSENSEVDSHVSGGTCKLPASLDDCGLARCARDGGPVTFYGRFHTSIWLAVTCVPVCLIVLPWALFADLGCTEADPAGHDGVRQNVQWFTWVWDMVYIIVAEIVAIGVIEILYFAPCVGNWDSKLRARIQIPSAAVSMAFCVGVKAAILGWELHTLSWAWLLVKHVVILVATVSFVVALLCAMWRTPERDAKVFALVRWCAVFAFAVWALAFYILNQVFVKGYILLAWYTQRHQVSTTVTGAIDFAVALFWSVVWVPCWAVAGGAVVGVLKRSATALHKDRLHLVLLLWVELFDTCFGRLVFKEVQIEPILLLLILKDSSYRILDLAFRYMPLRMVRLAMRWEEDESSWCFQVFKPLFALLLGVDLHVVLDCLFCGRSDHEYQGGSPGGGAAAAGLEEPSSSGHLHKYHIQRSRWRDCSFTDGAREEHRAPGAGPPAGTLDWAAAMSRALDCSLQLAAPPRRSDTHLSQNSVAISRAVEESHELESSGAVLPGTNKSVMSLQSMQSKRSDLLSCCGCKRQVAGVPRQEIKGYLMFAWNLGEWSRLDDLEAEALCDQICLVQRNLRLKFVAACLPRVASSLVGIAFVFLRRYAPCSCLALGTPAHVEGREIRMWVAIALLDALEVAVVSWTHWRHNLHQHDHKNWHWVRRVLWSGWLMLLAAAASTHILQDTYYAFYAATF